MSAIKELMTQEIQMIEKLSNEMLVTLHESQTQELGRVKFTISQSMAALDFSSTQEKVAHLERLRESMLVPEREEVVISYRNEVLRRLGGNAIGA